MKVQNKVIVVTGGGNGMGREMVLLLLKKGAKVAAIDLRDTALEETKVLAGSLATNLSLHIANIADKERVSELPAEITAAHGQIDGLINNAGIIQPFVPVSDLDFDVIERVLNVNLYGTLYMTKAFLPILLKRPEAHLANVSSMGGFMPFPKQTIYGASKAAVKLLSEGMAAELMDTNVKVSVIFPGAIGTDVTKNSGVEVGGRSAAEEEQMKKMTLSPDKAAEQIIEGIEANKVRIYVGKDSKMLNIFYRLSPNLAMKTIANKMKGKI